MLTKLKESSQYCLPPSPLIMMNTRFLSSSFRLTSRVAAYRITQQQHSFSSATTTASRPFQILGVQQIAIGGLVRSELETLWFDVFGLSKHSSHHMPGENVDEDILQVGPAPYAVEIDLMTPIDPEKSPKVGNCAVCVMTE